ncbi:DUF429 domain-containing protein [Candidatus Bathyarchaeota archaeon]|nr:MAG: DUF429 domain-containing protein [Candidatus Bathyarchaeota archaeon]
MIVVGIDLAGVEDRPSGFCVLESMNAKTCLLYTDREILQKIRKLKPDVVAIDAPLSLPPGRTSIEERTHIHLRECDRELLKRGIRILPITLGGMRKLTQRGIKLRSILEAEGFTVIEVYPGGAQDVLGIPRKSKGRVLLLEGLKRLGIKGLRREMSDHELDAVTSAFVGKLFLEGKSETLGDPKRGIVMPKV